MKFRIILVVMILTLCGNLIAQDEIKITWDYQDLTFREFAARVDSTYGIRIFLKMNG